VRQFFLIEIIHRSVYFFLKYSFITTRIKTVFSADEFISDPKGKRLRHWKNPNCWY